MLDAVWLCHYSAGCSPAAAYKNNTAAGRQTIETAFADLTHTLAVSPEEKNRVFKWMYEFRVTAEKEARR